MLRTAPITTYATTRIPEVAPSAQAARSPPPPLAPARAVEGALPRPAVVPGRTNDDYMDATAHAGARDMHFKMDKMANVDGAHNGPLDWMGLFEALFGGLLLPEGVSITLARAMLEKRVTTAVVFFGTNCPGFSCKQGWLEEDPKLAGRYRSI